MLTTLLAAIALVCTPWAPYTTEYEISVSDYVHAGDPGFAVFSDCRGLGPVVIGTYVDGPYAGQGVVIGDTDGDGRLSAAECQ